jgi:hypothetical protein
METNNGQQVDDEVRISGFRNGRYSIRPLDSLRHCLSNCPRCTISNPEFPIQRRISDLCVFTSLPTVCSMQEKRACSCTVLGGRNTATKISGCRAVRYCSQVTRLHFPKDLVWIKLACFRRVLFFQGGNKVRFVRPKWNALLLFTRFILRISITLALLSVRHLVGIQWREDGMLRGCARGCRLFRFGFCGCMFRGGC